MSSAKTAVPAPPKDVGPAGRAAFLHAVEFVAGAARYRGALERFAHAVDVAARVRDEWQRQGFPLLSTGGSTGTAEVAHPLVRMLAEAERDAARAGAALGLDPTSARKVSARPGRPVERGAAPTGAPLRARARLRGVD